MVSMDTIDKIFFLFKSIMSEHQQQTKIKKIIEKTQNEPGKWLKASHITIKLMISNIS